MYTLHIEHGITAFEVWKAAFDRFAQMRLDAGVKEHRVYQPVDDTRYVLIDLDFETADSAEKFLDFLHTRVWASPESAPALIGTPMTRILARA